MLEVKKELDSKQHKNIIQQFGGIYKNEKLQNYIESLKMLLITSSDLVDINFRLKILNTHDINSFSLHGKYIYITRGLIYYCQNEAQLAGIIANEISHLLLGNITKIYTRNNKEDLFTKIKSSTELSEINKIINFFSSSYFLKYSKIQENNANKIAVKLIIKAGFDPNEIVKFLNIIKDISSLQNRILNSENSQNFFFYSHIPHLQIKFQQLSKKTPEKISYNPIIGKEIFLKKLMDYYMVRRPSEAFFLKINLLIKIWISLLTLMNQYIFLTIIKIN